MRKRKADADLCGKLGAIARRAEQIERRQRDVLRHRADLAERVRVGKAALFEQQQFLKAFEEVVVLADVLAAAQRERGDLVGAGRAAETEVDPAGK